MTSANSGAPLLPVRQANSRRPSLSSGSFNPNHRVTRRKSVSCNNAATNAGAIAAAVREIGGSGISALSMSVPSSIRRHPVTRTAVARAGSVSNYPTPPSSLPSHKPTGPSMSLRKLGRSESAIEDDPNEEDEFDEDDSNSSASGNSRMRRASEGQYLSKGGESKKLHGGELKCDKCGKGYKHSSCLTKHLWEHTPEWSLTSKLLISKHQQVQLLEAASVLVAMNVDNTPPSSARGFHSDQEESSASPAASGYSDLHDSRQSSADTTPPPKEDQPNRFSTGSAFSRSDPSTRSMPNSVPSSVEFSGYQSSELSILSPDLAAVTASNREEDEGLANAIDLLSCSFSTPQNRVNAMPLDVPPVPPLPVQYASYATHIPSRTLAPIDRQVNSYAASDRYHHSSNISERNRRFDDGGQADVKMEDGDDSVIDDDEYEQRSRGRSDEDDEGVFGRMEE